jgi:hypothetical protein
MESHIQWLSVTSWGSDAAVHAGHFESTTCCAVYTVVLKITAALQWPGSADSLEHCSGLRHSEVFFLSKGLHFHLGIAVVSGWGLQSNPASHMRSNWFWPKPAKSEWTGSNFLTVLMIQRQTAFLGTSSSHLWSKGGPKLREGHGQERQAGEIERQGSLGSSLSHWIKFAWNQHYLWTWRLCV